VQPSRDGDDDTGATRRYDEERRVEHNRPVDPAQHGTGGAPVYLIRTSRGWQVTSPAGALEVDGLVEGLSLADLVAEELGGRPEPDRLARQSVRGTAAADGEPADPAQARIAALERTVAQLEHALAARVATERAIGVLAERSGTDPRSAFESLRQQARSSGRPVAELAREVLAALVSQVDAPVPAPPAPRAPEPDRAASAGLTAEGRS
jgi:hypothetical protein